MRNLIISFCAIFLLSGCVANTAGISIASGNEHVILGNPLLAENLAFKNARMVDVNGRQEGQVVVQNLTTYTQKLQYRFNWYDIQGLEVDEESSPWQHVVIDGMQERTLKEVPINPSAVNFRVWLRELK